jgi:hypothetical protein
MMEYLDEYISNLYLSEQMILYEFDIGEIQKRLLPKTKLQSWTKKFASAAESKDMRKVMGLIKKIGVPKITQDKADKIGKTMDSDYEKRKRIANQVLLNSLDIKNKKVAEAAASIISVASTIKPRNDNRTDEKRMKDLLKKVVSKANKFYEEETENKEKKKTPDDSIDMFVGMAIIGVVAALFISVPIMLLVFLPKIVFIIGMVFLISFIAGLGRFGT